MGKEVRIPSVSIKIYQKANREGKAQAYGYCPSCGGINREKREYIKKYGAFNWYMNRIGLYTGFW